MLYIRLFHGRTDPAQDMDGWGSDWPVLGPYEFVHTTYSAFVRLAKKDGDCDELNILEKDMLYYDSVYYDDWSVFTDETLKKGKFVTIPFEQSKANLPTKPS